MLGPGYLTGSGLWRNLGLRESIKVTPSNMSLEEGCEADRCYLRWDEFPPDHGKAAALYRLDHIFGFVQLGWLRVDLHSQESELIKQVIGLIGADSPHWKTKCWCRTCRAQEGR